MNYRYHFIDFRDSTKSSSLKKKILDLKKIINLILNYDLFLIQSYIRWIHRRLERHVDPENFHLIFQQSYKDNNSIEWIPSPHPWGVSPTPSFFREPSRCRNDFSSCWNFRGKNWKIVEKFPLFRSWKLRCGGKREIHEIISNFKTHLLKVPFFFIRAWSAQFKSLW